MNNEVSDSTSTPSASQFTYIVEIGFISMTFARRKTMFIKCLETNSAQDSKQTHTHILDRLVIVVRKQANAAALHTIWMDVCRLSSSSLVHINANEKSNEQRNHYCIDCKAENNEPKYCIQLMS